MKAPGIKDRAWESMQGQRSIGVSQESISSIEGAQVIKEIDFEVERQKKAALNLVRKKGKEYLLGSRMGQLQLLEKFPTYVKER